MTGWIPRWARPVVVAWVVGHVLTVGAAVVAVHVAEPGAWPGAPGQPVHYRSVARMLAGWDGTWFVAVARRGYDRPGADYRRFMAMPTISTADRQRAQLDAPFFPALPVVIAAVHTFGASWEAAALIAGNATSLGAILAIALLGIELFGEEVGARAAVFLAISPMASVFAMPYSEGVALMAIGAAGTLVARRRWRLAGVVGIVAALTRPQGVLVALPLAWMARRRGASARQVLAIAVAPFVGLGVLMAIQHVTTGDALLFIHDQRAWGRLGVSVPGIRTVAYAILPALQDPVRNLALFRDAVFLIGVGLLLLEGLRRRLPFEWLAFGALTIALPAVTGSIAAEARYSLLCVPAFWVLALIAGRSRSFDVAYRIAALALLCGQVMLLPYSFP